MRFRVRFAEQVVGAFILVAVVGMAAILILIGANQRWFAKNYSFTSEFVSGTGVSVGLAIQFKGFEIGKISAIDLNDRNTVDVEFYIYDTYYDKIKHNSVLELSSSPLGLGGGLVYHPGLDSGLSPPEEGYFIPALDTMEGKRRISEGLVVIPKSEDMISSLLGQVDPILGELDQTIAQVKVLITTLDDELSGRGSGPVSTLLTTLNDELAGIGTGPISETLIGLNQTTQRVNSLLDTVEQDVIVSTMDQLDELLVQLKTVTGNVIDITSDVAETTESLKDPTGLVTKLLGAKGSIPALLDDDNALYDQIEAMLTTVSEIVDQLKGFTEFISGSTPQISGLIEKGQDALDEGIDVMTAIKNNPLLRGGVPEQREQPTTFQSMRDVDF